MPETPSTSAATPFAVKAAFVLDHLRREQPDETTYQVVADGEILRDFTSFFEAAAYIYDLNDDWQTVELVTIEWRRERVERTR